jgi:hypothetical protein
MFHRLKIEATKKFPGKNNKNESMRKNGDIE